MAASTTSVEQHSVDPIPLSDRHGGVRDQFTLWFAANSTALNIFFGGLAITLGLSFQWAIVAIILGTVIGSSISAVHAQQGPRLGVPQLIQSRGQFGYYGAVLLFVALVVMEFGFMASQVVIQAFSLHQAFSGVSVIGWMLIVAVPVLVLVLFGHDVVHQWQKVATVVLLVSAVVLAVQIIAFNPPATVVAPAFSLPVFFAVTAVFVINTAAWAPNISDYSRYLPPDTKFWSGFNAVFWGMNIAVVAFGLLGARIVSMLPSQDLYSAVQTVSGSWFLVIMGISLTGTNAINVYTGALSALSGVGSFGRFRFTAVHRVIACVLVLAAGLACALTGYQSFLDRFVEFLEVLAFVFLPWSAINMLDFYFFRRGDYDVASLYTPRGVYGRIQWLPVICYLFGVGIELLFVDQTFYSGPLVEPLGGNDISWIVGFIVPLVTYWIAGSIAGRKKSKRGGREHHGSAPAPGTVRSETAPSNQELTT